MNKKKTLFLPFATLAFAALVLTACDSSEPSSSAAPDPSSSEPASSSSVDPNANKRVTQAIFTSEVTEFGMFGLDRKVTVTGTSPDLGGDNYSISLTTKFDNGKVSIKQETKAKADGTVVDTYEHAFLLEKDAEDGKIYYKERYVQNSQGEWQKNTTKAEFDITAMYDMGIIPDKYVFSNFTFDETTGTYKCPSIQTQIYGDDYLVENIEISFQDNKVMNISNKLTSQNADHPGSYSMTSVFSAHGSTTVTLPEVQESDAQSSKELSDLFYNLGEETLYIAASKERPIKKGLYTEVTSGLHRKNLLTSPGILLYLVGQLYEFDGFDCLDKLVRFRGVYDLGPTGTTVLDNTVDLMISIDKDNGKVYFYGYQDSIQTSGSNSSTIVSPIYVEIDYDFEKGEMGDFKLWEITGSETPSTNYCEYIDGVLKTLDYNHRNDDGDYAKESAVIEAAVATMNEKRESMTVADAETALRYAQGFIATQDYANEILDLGIQMSIHTDK